MTETARVSFAPNEGCFACEIRKEENHATPLRISCADSVCSKMFLSSQESMSEGQEFLMTSPMKKRKKSFLPKKPRRVSIAKLRLPDSIADFIIEAEKSTDEPISDEEYTSCLNIIGTTKGRREQVKRICEILEIERPKRKVRRKSEPVWSKQVWKNAGLHHLLGAQSHTFDDVQSALDMIELL